MGQVYTIEFTFANFDIAGGDWDPFELRPPSPTPFSVVAVVIENFERKGDAEEEQIRWQIVRGHTVSGSGSTQVGNRLDDNDFNIGVIADRVSATVASGGSPEIIHAGVFNNRKGLHWWPTPEMRPKVDGGQTTLVIRFPATLMQDHEMSGTIYFERL